MAKPSFQAQNANMNATKQHELMYRLLVTCQAINENVSFVVIFAMKMFGQQHTTTDAHQHCYGFLFTKTTIPSLELQKANMRANYYC